MKFVHPTWLATGIVACLLLLWLWRRHDARQRAALARFVSTSLGSQLTRSLSIGKRRLQRGLFMLALLLLCAALAGPLVGYRWEEVSRRGNDIVFALDTSRSMTTPDIKPDRLTRAKLAIDDFVHRLDGDAVGIIAFAGSAYLVCPITLDYGAFHESLSAVDTNTVPRGGTNISSAIREAQAALLRRPGSDKILILVTDGEDLEGSALTAAQAARQAGLKIYTVGVGSAAGDLIPQPPAQGGGFVKDETGAFVRSRLDEAGLQAIAAATGAFYVPLGIQGEGLDTIYTKVLGPLAKHDLASRQQKIYIERYQWPLAASLATLLASLLIGTRRRVPRPAATRAPAPASSAPARADTPTKVTTATLVAVWLISWHVHRAYADTPVTSDNQVANRAANSPPVGGKPTPGAMAARPPAAGAPAVNSGTGARADTATPSRAPILDYNAGTAAYRAGQFPQAATAFEQSIRHAPSSDSKRLADQEDAYYNLGNTLYRTGQKSEQSAPDEALKQWNAAVKAYETALQLRANDADSKFNRDLVKRKIAALQQQQKPPQNNDKQKGQGQGQGQGNPPPGQPQNSPDNAKNNAPPQPGQQPPASPPPSSPPSAPPGQQAQQPPGSQQPQPPPTAGSNNGQPPPGPDQPPAPPANGRQPPTPAAGAADQQAESDAERAADNQHLPGQMSREEARELLDSAKDEERHPPGAPLARGEAQQPPDKPFKNW